MAILKPMTLEEYHNNIKLPSPSVLSEALKSPAHLALYLQKKRKPTDEYNFGSLIHEFIENEFAFPDKLYKREDELYQRATGTAKAGDPKLDEDGDPKFTYSCIGAPERSLTAAYSKKAQETMRALTECKELQDIFELGKVVIEPSMTGTIHGQEVKCRPDILVFHEDGIALIEIKTTRHGLINMENFSRDFFDMNYDMQCYIESKITSQNYPDTPVQTFILAVSSDMPCGSAFIDIPNELFEIGREKAKDALAVWETHPTKTSYFTRGTMELSYKANDYRVRKGIE